jgi:iron complex transport system ATP-binding protein
VIALKNFSYRQAGKILLDDISFYAAEPGLIAIIGPNGAGKSTFLQGLAGLLPGGQPRPRDIGYLPQASEISWDLTVSELASLGRLPHGDNDINAIADALEWCGMTGFAGRRIKTLSGGELRRAEFSRVLAAQTQCLLLDEPLAGLDPLAQHEILRLLKKLADNGRLVIAVLHGVELAARYAARMIVLDRGRILADAAPAAALPAAASAFGMILASDSAPQLQPRGEI